MILPAGPVRVYVSTRPVNFRKGLDRLVALAQEELRLDPFSGAVLVFRAKRADQLKIVLWDGSGLVLIAKRLDAGQFAWPAVKDGVMTLSPAQVFALVEGLDWQRVHTAGRRDPQRQGSRGEMVDGHRDRSRRLGCRDSVRALAALP